MKRNTLKEWLGDKNNWIKFIIPALLLAGLFVAGRLIDIHEYLQAIQNWIWRLGLWGPVVFGAIYVFAILLLLFGTPFTIVAALLFGTLWGYVTMLSATTVAALAGFFIARYFGKGIIGNRLPDTDSLELLKTWIEKNLWLAIPFARIMPIFPFSINNYALGQTNVPFWSYFLAPEIIFIPMTAVLVIGASALYMALIRGEFSWELLLGTCGAGIIVLIIGICGKKMFMANDSEEKSL